MAAPSRTWDRDSAARHTTRVLESCLPDEDQPLWRRIVYVALATLVLFLLLPSPTVVSDVSHALAGFEAFPGQSQSFRAAHNAPGVWIVEQSVAHELYSNGLRVDISHAVETQQRFYQVLDRLNGFTASEEWLSTPAGIVFHATESPLAPFEVEHSDNIQRIGRALLTHVVANRAYNYLIDRFGRVYRIVEELHAANHAGNSVWSHGRSTYLNLNNSFLAISFESAGDAPLNTAQVFAGRMLTQMLRNKYALPMENCITHAQVSVNPSNLRIGYHTDGARAFPFLDMGLPNNYDLPVAAISEFGFTYDEAFTAAVGAKPWKGLAAAEQQLAHRAAAERRALEDLRSSLQARYKQLYGTYKSTGAVDEVAR